MEAERIEDVDRLLQLNGRLTCFQLMNEPSGAPREVGQLLLPKPQPLARAQDGRGQGTVANCTLVQRNARMALLGHQNPFNMCV
jgi:hypothetical protein